MQQEQQRDWTEFFDKQEKNRLAREKFISELDADERVKLLLSVLDRLAEDRQTQPLLDGSREIAAQMSVVAWFARRSERTIRRWINLAILTPYLELIEFPHQNHTFRVCWPAIVDR